MTWFWLSCNEFLTLKSKGTIPVTIAVSVKRCGKETFSKIRQIMFSVPCVFYSILICINKFYNS